MLVSFAVTNWKSIRDEICISSIAEDYEVRNETIPRLKSNDSKLVPFLSLYGANASGKSNFVDALSFARDMVVEGVRTKSTIPIVRFLLDKESMKRPSTFKFEMLVNETVYGYEFTVSEREILHEKLTDLTDYDNEKILFNRNQNRDKFKVSKEFDSELMKFAFRTTRDNQLFLNSSVSSNIDTFSHIFDWFNMSLLIYTPDSTFLPMHMLADENNPLSQKMSQMLDYLDTGIVGLKNIEVPTEVFERIIPQKFFKPESIPEGEVHVHYFGDQRYTITRQNGSISVTELALQHRQIEGEIVPFNLNMESDGTIRLIDILPVLIALTREDSKNRNTKVLVVDEIDRSLHPILTKSLINSYLDACTKDSRCQLICTTHDLLLMDQYLLRPDEMWITERDNRGISKLYSISQFNDLKGNEDIRKFYMAGKFGGIPQILYQDTILDSSHYNEDKE